MRNLTFKHGVILGAASAAVLILLFALSFDRYNPLKENPLLDSNRVLQKSIDIKDGELKVIHQQNEEQAKLLSDTTELVSARNEVARLERRLQQVRVPLPAFTSGNAAYNYLKKRANR